MFHFDLGTLLGLQRSEQLVVCHATSRVVVVTVRMLLLLLLLMAASMNPKF